MYGVAPRRVQVQDQSTKMPSRQAPSQLSFAQPPKVTFRGDNEGKYDSAVDLGKDVLDKATTKPDESTIKAGLAAVVTVVGLFLAKNAEKIKQFVDKGSKSQNKFVKAVAVTAGLVMSLLSIIGASTIFKNKVGKAEEETKAPPVSKEKAPEAADESAE
jgi:hypothetical protein